MHSHDQVKISNGLPKRFDQANLWSQPAGGPHNGGWPWNTHQDLHQKQVDQKDENDESQINQDAAHFLDSQHAVTSAREHSPHRHEKGWLWNRPASLDSNTDSNSGSSSGSSALWLRDRRQHNLMNKGNGDRFFPKRQANQQSMLEPAREGNGDHFFPAQRQQEMPSNLNLLSHRKNLWSSGSAETQTQTNHAENQAENQADQEDDSDDGNSNGNDDDNQDDDTEDNNDDGSDSSSAPAAASDSWKSVWSARKYAGASESQPSYAKATGKVPLRNRLWEKN